MKQYGVEVTAEQLTSASGELNEDALDDVAGGVAVLGAAKIGAKIVIKFLKAANPWLII